MVGASLVGPSLGFVPFVQPCGLVNSHVASCFRFQGADAVPRSSTVISNSLTASNPSTAVAIEN